MERTQLQVPDMYADHHVMRARAAISALPGVQEVIASAAFQTVAVIYDPTLVSAEAIQAALTEAGYPPASESRLDISLAPKATRRGDPAWERLGFRTARTDARDVKANR